MTEETLKSVIDTERDISEKLQAERTRCDRWLRQELAENADWLAGELSRLESDFAEHRDRARAETEAQARVVVAEAQSWADTLLGTDDDALGSIIDRHLLSVLPGGTNDRPDDQG